MSRGYRNRKRKRKFGVRGEKLERVNQGLAYQRKANSGDDEADTVGFDPGRSLFPVKMDS